MCTARITKINIDSTNVPSHRVVPGFNGRVYRRIRCHSCNDLGHYSNQCPISVPSNKENNMQ